MNTGNTPYDDVFRTLLNDCSKLILPVINEIFGEHYTGEETIVFSPNEHFLNKQDGIEEERITDTSFQVVGKETKKYHWECQSTDDSSMLVRFFEYDAQIALIWGKTIKNEGWLEGKIEGRKEGKIEVLFDLVENHVFTIKEAVSYANLTVEDFLNKIEFYKKSELE